MRSKYKKKQLQEKIEDLKIPRIIENQINKKDISVNLNSQKNYTLIREITPNKFNKLNNINDLNRENMNNRLINKNSFSVSFKKEIIHNKTFNKVFKEKDNEKNFFKERNEKNETENENDDQNKHKRSYSIRNLGNYNNNQTQKELLLNRFKNKNNSQKKNLKEIYDLTKNNSQQYNTIINSGNDKKEINNFTNNNNKLKLLNNIIKINEENKLFKTSPNNNIQNNQKFNINDTVKKLNIENNSINSISRNRKKLNNIDYFSNRKNKNDYKNININNNNNNNFSQNEKGNSLSVISEKISLLNSFEENSIQKEEKENLKEKKIFSSKNKKDNSEISSNNNLENIIEIREENENLKNEKNNIQNLKNKYKFKNRKNEAKSYLNKSIELLNPQIQNEKNYLKRNSSIEEIEINFDNIGKKKRNSTNSKDESRNPFISISLVNNIKKDNYLYNRREKNSSNYCSSFRELNENINNLNNKTRKNYINKENNELEIQNNESINYDEGSVKRIKKKYINNNSRQSDSFLKIDKENEISNNNVKRVNKEINININNNYFHEIKDYKSENNIITPLMKKNQSLPIRSFKFLVHQANHNDIIKDSFNKYYEINKIPNNNNNNESLSISTETNFSNKVKNNNNNLYPDIFDYSKKGCIKSPIGNISHFYINNDNFLEEENNNKKRPKISLKQNLIKSSTSELLNHIMNDTFDNDIGIDKNNINDSLNNRTNENNNYNKKIKNEIINNNIYSTTLNIYKINDNNNDDYSQFKSILTPSTIKSNILFKNNNKNNDMNIIKINNNILSNNYIPNKNNNKSNYISSSNITDDIEIEIFYNLEKKILLLINKIDDYKMCKIECYNYINYYYENRIDEYITKLFRNNHNKINIINYLKIELLCYLLCYDISYSNFFNQAAILIKSIINILNNNFLLILLLVLNNFYKNLSEQNKQISTKEKKIISELKEIIKNNLTVRIDEDNINELYVIQAINNKTKDINNYYKMILDNLYKEYYSIKSTFNNNDYKFPNCLQNLNSNNIDKRIAIVLFFFDSYRLLNNYTIIDLKKFFDIFLNRTNNNEIENNNIYQQRNEQDKEQIIDTLASSASKNSNLKPKIYNKNKEISALKNMNKISILPDINKKKYKYTLILPFNEVLVHLDKILNNYMIRPGLFEFINEIKEIYELILFSNDNSIYEEQVIENIQKEKNFFDYILNKNNGIEDIYYFIQDLNSLNRNIQRFIIIDTSINRFKSYKNNLLIIKPFYGDIRSDKKTLNYLSQLLRNISKDTDITDDIRISLNKSKKSFIYSKLSK